MLNILWESKRTPPMPPPPRNKAFLRDYLPLLVPQLGLIKALFLAGRVPLDSHEHNKTIPGNHWNHRLALNLPLKQTIWLANLFQITSNPVRPFRSFLEDLHGFTPSFQPWPFFFSSFWVYQFYCTSMNFKIDTSLSGLTWNLKMGPWKRRFLLDTIIFMFYVKLWGCTFIPQKSTYLENSRCQTKFPSTKNP